MAALVQQQRATAAAPAEAMRGLQPVDTPRCESIWAPSQRVEVLMEIQPGPARALQQGLHLKALLFSSIPLPSHTNTVTLPVFLSEQTSDIKTDALYDLIQNNKCFIVLNIS